MGGKRFYRWTALALSALLLFSEGGALRNVSAKHAYGAEALAFGGADLKSTAEDGQSVTEFSQRTAEKVVSQYMDMGELEGFAAMRSEGLLTTTGGNGGKEVVIVENTVDFANAIKDDEPRVVVVKGEIVSMLSNSSMDVGSATNLENKMAIKNKGGYGLSVGSNKTIVGYDEDAELYGGLNVNGKSNVIISNLKIHGVWPYTGPSDTMEVSDSHHVWLNHLEIWNSKDGNLDIKTGADYITVSWCRFWYEDVVCEWDTTDGTNGNREYKKGETALAKNHGHRLSCLIGSGAGDHDDTDMDKLHVTYHHNWFADFVNERMPRVMYGRAHVYNNFYTCNENLYCIGVDSYASVLIENNYFLNVRNPHQFSYPENKKLGASIVARGNAYENVSGTKAEGQMNDKAIPAFKNAPYDYHLNEADDVPMLTVEYSGNCNWKLADYEKGKAVAAVNTTEKPDTSKALPAIAPANKAANDKAKIVYDDSSKTYTYNGQNADGSNGFYTIANPFAGKDFSETLTLKDGYPAWTKGVTIAYWVKLPASANSVQDAAVLNFNLENERSLYNRDEVHYQRCRNYTPSNPDYSMGEMKKYVDAEGRVFTVLENYGKLVRYNPSYPTTGYYCTAKGGGAYRVYEQGTDPETEKNWTYLNYIGTGYYADYAYLYDEDPVYGVYSRHREALISGSFSLYASGSMGYRQDGSADNTLQRNPNLPTYGNYMSMHKMNQFYYWANGSEYTNKNSALKSPSMADTASKWHYVVTVITNDWVQTYIDGTELTTEYLNYWGNSFRLQNSAEGFNLGYGHRGFYRTKNPSMDFEGDRTILDFISDKNTTLCIGGLGAGAEYVGQHTIKTPNGTQVRDLAFYDVPLSASQISADKVTLPADYKEAARKTEGGRTNKYAVIPDEELEPSIVKAGDVDKDGNIAINDALSVLKYVAKMIDLDEEAKGLADVDGKEGVTIEDAISILKYVAKIIDGFGPEAQQRAWEKQMEKKFGLPKEWLDSMGIEWYHRTDTPPAAYMVDKPIRSDLQGYNQCWAYAVAMILRYLGEDITGEEFFQEFPYTREDNTAYSLDLAEYLKGRAGYKTHLYMGDQMDLKDAVSKHGIVMLLLQIDKKNNVWHYADVSGYDEKHYYICDPMSTLNISDRYNKVRYPEELEEEWHTVYPDFSYLFYVIEKEEGEA